MRTSRTTALIAVLAFAAAAIGALVLLDRGNGTDTRKAAPKQSAARPRRATSGSSTTPGPSRSARTPGSITPDGDTQHRGDRVPLPGRRCTEPQDGTWVVRVTQDGAEGPFADGWRLLYRADDSGTMQLWKVATGKERAIEAEVASIVLGSVPYETSYKAPPKDLTLEGAALRARTTLPPTALPAGGPKDPSTKPPTDAPNIPSGDAPPSPRG